MRTFTRLGALREYLRGSLWVLPTVSVLAAVVAGALLALVTVDSDSMLTAVLFGGGADGARAVLEVIAGSVITVTSVTFSLTVVALQMAATQYSPRLLRNFLQDRGNQVVLSVFLATFAFCLTLLRSVRSGVDGGQVFVPRLGVTVALLLALASVGALVYFIHHITQSIRVETILRDTVRDTRKVIGVVLPPGEGSAADDGDPLPDVPSTALAACARSSGFVQSADTSVLVTFADEHDLGMRFCPTIGEYLAEGTTLAWAWSAAGSVPGPDADEIEQHVNNAVQLGNERTFQQDIGFGIRQLADVAVRAVSPSTNDPTTAVDTLARMSVILRDIASRQAGHNVAVGEQGRGRVAMPYPDFAAYLDLACGQIAHYGSSDVVVARAIVRMLGEVGAAVRSVGRKEALIRQLDRAVQEAERQLPLEVDRARVRGDADDVRQQLAGDLA